MNTIKALLGLSIACTLFASASPAADTTAVPESRKDGPALPVPVKVVGFTEVPQRFEGATVKVVMTIDETGTPRGVTGWSPLPDDLAKRIVPVLAQWKFAPARNVQGTPVSVRVMLPLELVSAP